MNGSGAGAGAGASGGGGGGYSGGYGGGGGGGSTYGLGDNPYGSGIGTRGQGGRTQNKTFAEILALAPSPQFMPLVTGGQGVKPGNITGSGGMQGSIPNFLPVSDATGDYKSVYQQPAVRQLTKQAGQAARSGLEKAYESLFGKDEMTGRTGLLRGNENPQNLYPEEMEGGLSRGYEGVGVQAEIPEFPTFTYGGAY